jgi:cyclophilin family peptidyl-prolyl cis-trans isomerase
LAKKRKKCPFCYAEVNKENLERHFLKVHGELSKEEFKKHGLKKPSRIGGKKKTQKVGKRASKKGNKLNNNKRNAVITAIVLIIIVSLVGALIYQNLGQNQETNGEPNEEPNGEIPNNGNGETNLPVATMTTTLGTIKIELDTEKAPDTAKNFIDLTNSGFYNGIIFHRVIAGFVIQGGGFTEDGDQKNAGQIPWENTGLKNAKYSIAMARSGDANDVSYSGTATSQFFINLKDNSDLDDYTYPYVVFGRVVEGFSVVDSIAALPTDSNEWPDNPPVITSVVIED